MTDPLNITVTDAAREKFRAALDAEGTSDHVIRMAAEKATPIKVNYILDFSPPDSKQPDDLEMVVGDVKIWVDPASAQLLDGTTVDYVAGLQGEGFKFNNPNESAKGKSWTDPVAARFQELLDSEINPGIASHGGQITLLEYKDSKAYVQMGGGCQGCGMASVTLRQGIESRVKELIPEITEIIDTTDHASGDNPYFQPGK